MTEYKTCNKCSYDILDSEGEVMEHECLIHKRLHEINTFQCLDNELYLRGKDEYGQDFQICFDAFNFLEWIDKEQIDYIKQKVIEYVEKK
jgi:hypothetical protein